MCNGEFFKLIKVIFENKSLKCEKTEKLTFENGKQLKKSVLAAQKVIFFPVQPNDA